MKDFFKKQCIYIEHDRKLYTTSLGCISTGPTYETIAITKTADSSYSVSLKYDRSIDPNSEYIRIFNYIKERGIWVLDDMVAGLYDVNSFECTYEDENVVVLLYKGSLGILKVRNDVNLNLRTVHQLRETSGTTMMSMKMKDIPGIRYHLMADDGKWLSIQNSK